MYIYELRNFNFFSIDTMNFFYAKDPKRVPVSVD